MLILSHLPSKLWHFCVLHTEFKWDNLVHWDPLSIDYKNCFKVLQWYLCWPLKVTILAVGSDHHLPYEIRTLRRKAVIFLLVLKSYATWVGPFMMRRATWVKLLVSTEELQYDPRGCDPFRGIGSIVKFKMASPMSHCILANDWALCLRKCKFRYHIFP